MSLGIEAAVPISMGHLGAYLDEKLNFTIHRVARPTSTTPDNITYQPLLAIYSTDQKELEVVRERIINGAAWNLNDVDKKNPPEGNPEWYLKTGDCVECFLFTEWIKPHLVVKKTQAEIFINFLYQKREVVRYTRGAVKVPRLYPTPYERMEVEEDFRQRLIKAKSQVIKETTLPDLERLGGTIDADMSLGLYLSTERPRAPHLVEFIARATMVSVRQALLDMLYAEYGGTKPVKYSDTDITKSGLPTFKWQVNGQDLQELLTAVWPYLVFKRVQAKFIIESIEANSALARDQELRDRRLKQGQRARMLQTLVDKWPSISSIC